MKPHFNWCFVVPLLLAVSLALASCVTTDNQGSSKDKSAPSANGGADSLQAQGRKIYYGRCTACHQPEPVEYYTLAEWDALLPEMSEDAKLNAQQQQALRAFIVAELKS